MRRKSEQGRACSTSAKRAALVGQVLRLAAQCGAVVAETYTRDRETYLALALGDYRVSMHFTGGNDCGAFLGHWHTASRSAARYPKTFGLAILGTVNQYHYGKATTCEETFDGFLLSLRNGFNVLNKEAMS